MERQISLINNEDFDSLDKSKKSKIYFLAMQDLKSNPLNRIYEKEDSKEDLDELIESIKETGLQQPLTVSKSDEGYVLLSGHRRMKALTHLFKQGIEVRYNGLILAEDNVPVIIQYVCKTKEEQFRALVASNCYRHLSKETNRKLIAEAIKIYNKQLSSGKTGSGRIRDNIAKIANVSGRSVQRYVDFGKKGEPVKMKEEKKEALSSSEQILKKLDSMIRTISSIELDDYGNLDRKIIREKLRQLSFLLSEKQ
ncbi:MAG: ParB N-terminal domain-containing protein [Erysipelotrichaceae bacterium]|nr:ParB N-terminal domain-containing protein [Erysipelotrichaceae bacterium]